MAYKPRTKPKPGARRPSRRPSRWRRKKCKFCMDKTDRIDYKDITRLQRSVTERGKIIPSRITGTCAKHQRYLASAIKKARSVALLAFTGE